MSDKAPQVALSLTPPSRMTDNIQVEIRGAVRGAGATDQEVQVSLYLDVPGDENRIYQASLRLPAAGVAGFATRLSTAGLSGEHRLIMEATRDGVTQRCERHFEVVPATGRSTRSIGGAWVGLLHFSEGEGRYWNEMLATFTEADWREMVQGMHRVGMDLIIVQETWRNPIWYGEHYHQMTLETYRDTYEGKAFYPSNLWPGRMELPCADPVQVILEEADRLGMQVMLGLGLYAHFDYTPGSLAWHRDVMRELWDRYGSHESLYGWYISEEIQGHLKPHEIRYWDRTETFRQEVLDFFTELSALRDELAPHTPIMLAPGSHHHGEALETWAQLARVCDIFCIQGYQRMCADGMPVDENIARMQAICDEAGGHLWMDMEAFGFEHPDKEGPQREGYNETLPDGTEDFIQVPLIPQTMGLLADELETFQHFEFICAYQYPGIFCAPDAGKRLGGDAAVALFQDYRAYLQELKKA